MDWLFNGFKWYRKCKGGFWIYYRNYAHGGSGWFQPRNQKQTLKEYEIETGWPQYGDEVEDYRGL